MDEYQTINEAFSKSEQRVCNVGGVLIGNKTVGRSSVRALALELHRRGTR